MQDTHNSARVNPFGELIGLRFTEFHSGQSRCQIEVSQQHLNPNGVVHGGVVYSMADTGMGAALHSQLGEGEHCATIEIKIVYLKPVTAGTLVCESRVIHRGKSTAVLESDVLNHGQLVARAMGTFSVLKSKPINTIPPL
jgi:acyl-CoA thioesterase